MCRSRPLRPLLRWISLVGSVALLAWFGTARTHQQNFPLFLATVMGLSVLIAVVYVFTSTGESEE